MKVGQSSNEHELKLNLTAVNSEHRSLDKVFGELDRHDLKQNICSWWGGGGVVTFTISKIYRGVISKKLG